VWKEACALNLRDISVIVTTFNEETNLGRCLRAVNGFGEIIVVDSFSSDRTLEIARSFPSTIYTRPYRSAARQKNWALRQAKNGWVLILDADEEASEALVAEIKELDTNACDGYWIRRESDYLGGPIRHCGWQRDKVLRLFRRSAGRYEEREVHEEVTLGRPARILRHYLKHYPYARVEQHFRKIDEYSTRGARDYISGGGRMPVFNMLVHPPFRFLRMYFLQRGVLDGYRGFILCLLSSYGVFLKYAKAWELKRCRV
jgi:glycosyltransferase involved in cell wall biosynthesis